MYVCMYVLYTVIVNLMSQHYNHTFDNDLIGADVILLMSGICHQVARFVSPSS